MIIYNVTIKVTTSIAINWLQWLKEEHIPDVLSTGCFIKATSYQLLEIDDSEGPTYVIQYIADSKTSYDLYIDKYAEAMRQKGFEKWGNQFIAFRTVMHTV